MTTANRPPLRVVTLAVLAMTLVGCASSGQSDPSVNPYDLQLELRSTYEDGRATIFELQRDGVLRFGGGRNALAGSTFPAGTLTREQFDRIWDVIESHDLLTGSGRLLGDAERVQHHVRIRSNRGSASYRAIDDDQPGLDALHAVLMEIQGKFRYSNVFQKLPDEQTRPPHAD